MRSNKHSESDFLPEELLEWQFLNSVMEGIADADAGNLIELTALKGKWSARITQRLVSGQTPLESKTNTARGQIGWRR